MLDAVLGALATDPRIRSVSLGGSRARGEADEFSDIDLVIEASDWEPARLGGLWLGGQKGSLGGSPFYHGVLADGTVLDVVVGTPEETYRRVEAPPIAPPPPVLLAEGAALDFWLNSLKHAKLFGRGLAGMVVFGLHHDAMALTRLWVLEDAGEDPGPEAFTIFGLTPIVRAHLTPDRLNLLGAPSRDETELREKARTLRDAAGAAGRTAEARWKVAYPHALEAVVRQRWAL